MNLRPRRQEDPEINLINMIDVLLVLLIFFMVSTTFNQEGRVKVQLPQSSDQPIPRGQHDPLIITDANLSQWVQPGWSLNTPLAYAPGPPNVFYPASYLNQFFSKPAK